jgi:hypothetical protein
MLKVYLSLMMTLFSLQAVWADQAAGLEEAKVMAAKTGKPILMDFMTEW